MVKKKFQIVRIKIRLQDYPLKIQNSALKVFHITFYLL